jgi:hypothetical protein
MARAHGLRSRPLLTVNFPPSAIQLYQSIRCVNHLLSQGLQKSSCRADLVAVGQTPWSARVPLDPLFTDLNLSQPPAVQLSRVVTE